MTSDSGSLSAGEHRLQLRRAVAASAVGTVIEAYDFLLYVLVAPLVFGKLYFPKSDPLVGTLEAFAIYAVGFVARPLGAALFGHYGDRIGRNATLITTLLLTGLTTFAVGFVPGYDAMKAELSARAVLRGATGSGATQWRGSARKTMP